LILPTAVLNSLLVAALAFRAVAALSYPYTVMTAANTFLFLFFFLFL
jgi:hypothetical protein